jgi:hypothetical protein
VYEHSLYGRHRLLPYTWTPRVSNNYSTRAESRNMNTCTSTLPAHTELSVTGITPGSITGIPEITGFNTFRSGLLRACVLKPIKTARDLY